MSGRKPKLGTYCLYIRTRMGGRWVYFSEFRSDVEAELAAVYQAGQGRAVRVTDGYHGPELVR